MTKINAYCEICHTWQEVVTIDIDHYLVTLHLSCGHQIRGFGRFLGGLEWE